MSGNGVAPTINPFQYGGTGNGTLKESVNLFRGAVSFYHSLVSLPERNGMSVELKALYHSDVDKEVLKRNQEMPTGIMGLGWELSYESIVCESIAGRLEEQQNYYLAYADSKTPLHRTDVRFKRGVLSEDFNEDLQEGLLADRLRQALKEQGIFVSQEAKITVQPDKTFKMVDETYQYVLQIEFKTNQYLIFDGGLAFENSAFDFSRIRYYKEFKKWEITSKEGVSSVYGGAKPEEDDAIQWDVAWDGWKGNSAHTHSKDGTSSQMQRIKSFNIKKQYNLYGDVIVYEYLQDRQRVGAEGLEYTKACYLSRVTDMFGNKIVLQYKDKDYGVETSSNREYADPYKKTPDKDPDAYQSCYETKYLDKIISQYPDGKEMNHLDFFYELCSYADVESNALHKGDFTKRMLKSIKLVMSNEKEWPSVLFDYQQTTENNKGAIKSITYPEGGQVIYHYAKNELPGVNQSALTIANPYTFGNPKIWFSGDFVLVLWGQNYDCKGTLYTFVGRWQAWDLEDSFDDICFDNVYAYSMSDYILVVGKDVQKRQTSYVVCHKDERTIGGWRPVKKGILPGDEWEFTAGEDFFLYYERFENKLEGFRWDGFNREWIQAAPSINHKKDEVVVFEAFDRQVGVLVYDINRQGTYLVLYYLDKIHGWVEGYKKNIPSLYCESEKVKDKLNLSLQGNTICISAVTNSFNQSFDYDVYLMVIKQKNDTYLLEEPSFYSLYCELGSFESVSKNNWVAYSLSQEMVIAAGNLFRYNGKKWIENNSLVPYSASGDDFSVVYAYSQDCIIKTEYCNDYVKGEALVYRPNQDSEKWSTEAFSKFNLYDDKPSGKYTPTGSTQMVTWNHSVYSMEDFMKGEFPFEDVKIDFPIGTDTNSVYNQSPYYIASIVKDEEEILGTNIYILRNGEIIQKEFLQESFFPATQEKGLQSSDGKMPGNETAFYTYINDEGDNMRSLTLYYLGGEKINQKSAIYQVVKSEIFDGMNSTGYVYEYDDKYAVCDESGQFIRYYSAKVYPHLDKSMEHGYTKYQYTNSLAVVSQLEHQKIVSLGDGQLEVVTEYNSKDQEVSRTEVKYELAFTAVLMDETKREHAIYGARRKRETIISSRDGVTNQVITEYDDTCGELLDTQRENYNLLGKKETHKNEVKYGHYDYDVLWYTNCLNKKILKKTVYSDDSGELIISSKASTLKNWCRMDSNKNNHYYVDFNSNYTWKGNEYSEFNFAQPESNLNHNWSQETSFNIRNDCGLITEKDAPIGNCESVIYDKSRSLQVAVFSKVSLDKGEAFYYGFEQYEEEMSKWKLNYAETPIVRTNSHTGKQCLCVLPGKKTRVLEQNVLVDDTTGKERNYMFYFWYFVSSISGNSISFKVENSDKRISKQIVLDKENEWTYAMLPIKIDENECLNIVFDNASTSSVYIDNFFFSRLEAPGRVNVYSENGGLLEHVISAYDQYQDIIYDEYDREVAKVDFDRKTIELSVTDLYMNDNKCHAKTVVKPMGKASYERFNNPTEWHENWSSRNLASWASCDNCLVHSGDSKTQIQYKKFPMAESYFAYFRIANDENVTLGVVIGEDIEITWVSDSNKYVLTDRINSKKFEHPEKKVGSNWLVVVGETILFLVDGKVIFSYIPAKIIQNKFALFAEKNVSFTNFLIGLQPQIGIQYFDFAGKKRQGHSLNGTTSTITEIVYDDLARASLHTKPCAVKGKTGGIFCYQEDFILSIDPENGIMKGIPSEAYPEDEGYPYARQRYEDNPSGRIIEKGIPGEKHAIKGGDPSLNHTTKYSFAQHKKILELLNLPENRYTMVSTKDPDEHLSIQVFDQMQTVIAESVCINRDKEEFLVTTHTKKYEKGKYKLETRLPNYYSEDQESKDSFIRIETYNYLGQQIVFSQPNSEDKNNIYNSLRLLRFSQDGPLTKKNLISYTKYDEFLRIIEQGVFSASWDEQELQRHVDENDSWPPYGENTTPYMKCYYDGDYSEINQLGQLTKTIAYQDQKIISLESSMKYDGRSRLIAKKLAINECEMELEQEYTYDNADHLTSTKYSTGRIIHYNYDQEGKLSVVQDQDKNNLFAYTYYPNDLIKEIIAGSINNCYSYNSQGWITGISNPYLKEELFYEEDDSGPFSGKLSKLTASLLSGDDLGLPKEITYEVKYDETGNLSKAICYKDGVQHPEWSIGLEAPVQYDSNGNIKEIQNARENEVYQYDAGTDKVIATDKGKSFTYDENGNVISAPEKGIRNIKYHDGLMQPIEIETDTEIVRYIYNESGQRLVKLTKLGKQIYIYNASGKILEEIFIDGAGCKRVIEYIYGSHGLEGFFSDGKMHYTYLDHLGSVRMLTDQNGNAQAAFHYSPYGEMLESSDRKDDGKLHYYYTGYEWDKEYGLYNANARFYDPVLKRFYGLDPKLEYASGYVYCGNDPFLMVDATGESSFWALLVGGIVSIICTVAAIATGGALAPLVAASVAKTVSASAATLATKLAVNMIGSIAGSMLGSMTTAAVDSEPITTSLVLSSLTSGVVSGTLGGFGKIARKGTTGIVKMAIKGFSMGSGFVAGVATKSAVVGNSYPSQASMDIGLDGLIGMGMGLLANFSATTNGEISSMNSPTSKATYADMIGESIFSNLLIPGTLNLTASTTQADTIASHGYGRSVVPFIISQSATGEVIKYLKPMRQPDFIEMLESGNLIPNNFVGDIKSPVCFSASFGKKSAAQAIANLNMRRTHGTKYLTCPTDPDNTWIQFT